VAPITIITQHTAKRPNKTLRVIVKRPGDLRSICLTIIGIQRSSCRDHDLRFISSSIAGRSLVRIVEEELIAVGIVDH
jgi:hypothetical protein